MNAQLRFPWLPTPVARISRAAARQALVPRMAAATAVRIPEPHLSQVPLGFLVGGPQIFVHEGARQRLERKLELAATGPVQLAVTDNRRRMVTHTRSRGTLRVRVHMMFLGAEDHIQDALIKYVVSGDKDASQVIGDFIDANNHRIRAERSVRRLNSQGRVHDLASILEDVSLAYFGTSANDVLISWGRRTKPQSGSRQTIKLGSYSALERLIRLHPVLDNEWVPRFFVAYIVYHELLHHVIPQVKVGDRTILHSPEFQQREREFADHERATAWEQKNIERLLRGR